MKRLSFGVLLMLGIAQQSFSFTDSFPRRDVEYLDSGIVVTYHFDEYNIFPSTYYEGAYNVDLYGFGVNDIIGEPSIVFRNDLFVVPLGATINVDILDCHYVDTTLILSPSVPALADDDSPIELCNITPYNGFFPKSVVQHDNIDPYRGEGLLRVTTYPIQYNYNSHIIRIYDVIKYRIRYSYKGEKRQNVSSNLFQKETNQNKIIENTATIVHKKNAPKTLTDSTYADDRSYLIITTNEYKNALTPFIEWKKLKGNSIYVESKNKGAWSTNIVRSVVDSFYCNKNIRYVLLIGGYKDIPADSMIFVTGNKEYKGVTDYYYGLPSSEGAVPQIQRGRIPADTYDEVENILNKIIQYERNPIEDSLFYMTGTNCAYFQDDAQYDQHGNIIAPFDSIEDRCFSMTSEEILYQLTINYDKQIHRVYYTQNSKKPLRWNNSDYSEGDSLPVFLRKPTFAWNGNSDSIKNCINNGSLYVLHRDHGSKTSWDSPSFTNYHIQQLNNGARQPVVFSLNCKTGKYNENGDCFAEKFIKKTDGGCVGIFAATETSFSGYNDAMALGMFDAIWPMGQLHYRFRRYNNYTINPEPIYDLGSILDQGLIRMGETYGRYSSTARAYTWKLFHCFGDPSMMIYTEKPAHFVEPSVFFRGDTVFVKSNDGECRITIVNYTTNHVNSYWGTSVSNIVGSDSICICLDRHNYIPYVWDKQCDIFIQNEDINTENRTYIGENVYIGNNVTPYQQAGDVIARNSNVTISARKAKLTSGTRILSNKFKIIPHH